MKVTTRLIAFLAVALAYTPIVAVGADLEQEVAVLDRESDAAKFDTQDGDERARAFVAVQQHAVTVSKQYPRRAEPLLREAWALIEQARALKTFGSLGLLKQARQQLETAIALDPSSADANATLGSLYFNAPKWPLSFGDRKKGRVYLQKALAINPTSDWQNLDYAKCLFKDEDYSGAARYAAITLQATVRPGSKRDVSLHAEAEALVAKAKSR